jgi:hypothetical protein
VSRVLADIILANDVVLQRLARSTVAIQKLDQENKEMKAIVQSTRNSLLQLNESLKQSEALEKSRNMANLARMRSERDRARNQESRTQEELQQLRAKVHEQQLELEFFVKARRSVNTSTGSAGLGNSNIVGEQHVTAAAASNGPSRQSSHGDPQRKPPAKDDDDNNTADIQPSAGSDQQDGSMDIPSRQQQIQRSSPLSNVERRHPHDEKQPTGSVASQVQNEQLIEGEKSASQLGGDSCNGKEQIVVVAGITPPTDIHSKQTKQAPSSSKSPLPTKHAEAVASPMPAATTDRSTERKQAPSTGVLQHAEKLPPTKQVEVSHLPDNTGIAAKSKSAVVEIIAADHKKKQDEQKTPNSKNAINAQVPSQQRRVENEPNSHPSKESSAAAASAKSPPLPTTAEVPKNADAKHASLPRGTVPHPPSTQHAKKKEDAAVEESIAVNKNTAQARRDQKDKTHRPRLV